MQDKKLKTESNRFTPFTGIVTSPAAKISQGKQLTGNLRIIRDSVAELHNYIQQWNATLLEGVTIIKTMTPLKVDVNHYIDCTLMKLCDDLQAIIEKSENISLGMRNIVNHVKSVRKLHNENEILFLTWPVQRFEDICEKICQAYEKEVISKRTIFENVAHHKNERQKIIYLAAWTHQIHLSETLITNLEAMLIETGLRNC